MATPIQIACAFGLGVSIVLGIQQWMGTGPFKKPDPEVSVKMIGQQWTIKDGKLVMMWEDVKDDYPLKLCLQMAEVVNRAGPLGVFITQCKVADLNHAFGFVMEKYK
jgi:hypothetical protein